MANPPQPSKPEPSPNSKEGCQSSEKFKGVPDNL